MERFENCKREFVEKGVSDKELLLFHGTDASNLDNIFTSNFKIDFQPVNRPKVQFIKSISKIMGVPCLCFVENDAWKRYLHGREPRNVFTLWRQDNTFKSSSGRCSRQ